MICDDDALSRKMLKKILLMHPGCRDLKIVSCADGTDAVKYFCKHQQQRKKNSHNVSFQLLLIDDQMKSLNGDATVKILRAMGFAGTTVCITGNSDAETKAKFLLAGADQVFVKPFSAAKLHSILENCLLSTDGGGDGGATAAS